jgi:hypothetical protein
LFCLGAVEKMNNLEPKDIDKVVKKKINIELDQMILDVKRAIQRHSEDGKDLSNLADYNTFLFTLLTTTGDFAGILLNSTKQDGDLRILEEKEY